MRPDHDLLKIAFITTVERNPGDAFIRAGIEYLLQQHIPYYVPMLVDKHEYCSSSAEGGMGARLFPGTRRLFCRMDSPTRDSDPFDVADLVVQAGAPLYYIAPSKDGSYTSFTSSITTDWIRKVWLNRVLRLPRHLPLLNLAVGTCQPFQSEASEFRQSPELLDFVRKTVGLSALTTVREKTAARLMEHCGLSVPTLPCTAIFATDHHRIYPEPANIVCLNYMEGASHYTLGQDIDFAGWQRTFCTIHDSLAAQYPVVVMCHSPDEVLRVRSLLPKADTFFSASYVDYLRLYARARFGVLNRVHGAMVLAGLGRPAVVVGNDSRSRMAELMHLPVKFVNDATAEDLLTYCADFAAQPEAWSRRLLGAKSECRDKYLRLLGDSLAAARVKAAAGSAYRRSDFARTTQRR